MLSLQKNQLNNLVFLSQKKAPISRGLFFVDFNSVEILEEYNPAPKRL